MASAVGTRRYEYELSPLRLGFDPFMDIDRFSSKICTWFPDLYKMEMGILVCRKQSKSSRVD